MKFAISLASVAVLALTACGGGGGGSNDQSTDLQKAKSFFAELRTTLNAFGGNGGFLDTQANKASADLNATVPPAIDKVAERLGALGTAANVYRSAKAYTASNTGGLTVGVDPSGATNNPVLIYQTGDPYATWNGWGSYEKCWTDSSTPASVTKLTCSAFGPTSADYANTRFKFVQFVLTPTATANQFSYTATRYNRKVTLTGGQLNPIGGSFPWNGSAGLATNALLTTAAATVNVPFGTGTFTGSTDSSQLSLNGTLPPSTSMCVAPNADSATKQSNDCPVGQILIPATGVDTIVINATRTALPTANHYHYAMSGSVSSVNAINTSKVSSISLDSGTYFDADETNANSTGSRVIGAKVIGTVQTAVNKFTGSITVGSFQFDQSGHSWTPTSLAFNGSISDISSGGAGQFLTGDLTGSVAGYSSYNTTIADSASNYLHATMTFTGKVQAPSRPLMTLAVSGTATGPGTGTVTLQYSYDNISITGSGNSDGSGLMLTNQDGVQVAPDPSHANQSLVTKSGSTLATIIGNVINYVDGSSASLN